MTNRFLILMTAKDGKEMKIIGKLFALIISVALLAFGAVQAVYWLNVDNKFMFVLYKVLQKHYENVPRDRRF